MKFIVCVVVVLLHDLFIAVALNDEQRFNTTHDEYGDSDVEPRGLEFGGNGYVILAKGNFRPSSHGAIRFSFRTFATEGLMFLMGRSHPGKDYLSIELKDGKVLAQYDLGSGSATLLSPNAYNDGNWHEICLNRVNQDSLLKIDGSAAASGRSPKASRVLGIGNEIYFGGYKGQHTYQSITQKPFKGCIKDVQLGNSNRDLNENLEINDVLPGCPAVITTALFQHSTDGGYISANSEIHVGTTSAESVSHFTHSMITVYAISATAFALLLCLLLCFLCTVTRMRRRINRLKHESREQPDSQSLPVPPNQLSLNLSIQYDAIDVYSHYESVEETDHERMSVESPAVPSDVMVTSSISQYAPLAVPDPHYTSLLPYNTEINV